MTGPFGVTSDSSAHYTLVYDGEAQIFENHHARCRAHSWSRTWLRSTTWSRPLGVMKEDGIDPRQTAVVEGASDSQIAALGTADGTAAITAYGPQHVSIDVEAKSSSLLLLTDSLPWMDRDDRRRGSNHLPSGCRVPGASVPPAGQHRVEFSYDPRSFRIGVAIAILGCLVLAGLVMGLNPGHRVRRVWLRRS